jgi:hypothetical protein
LARECQENVSAKKKDIIFGLNKIMGRYPNFLIIGAAKSGTTSLYQYLDQHPEIYMSPFKEPNFFSAMCVPKELAHLIRIITDLEEYQKLFDGVTKEKAFGEATTYYLTYPQVAEKIYQHIPKAKLIAILRNPAERAYSAFTYALQLKTESSQNFEEALAKDQERKKQGHTYKRYKETGYYFANLQNYYKFFPKEQIKICLYDDLRQNPRELLKSIFQFLEVDDSFTVDFQQIHNPTRKVRNRMLFNFLTRPNPLHDFLIKVIPLKIRKMLRVYERTLGEKFPPIPENVKIELLKEYREDILSLQDLIGRDLSMWLSPIKEANK